MKMLQIPTMELDQRIKEEMEVNPALEEGMDEQEKDEDQDNNDQNEETETENENDDVDLSEYFDDDDVNFDDRHRGSRNARCDR